MGLFQLKLQQLLWHHFRHVGYARMFLSDMTAKSSVFKGWDKVWTGDEGPRKLRSSMCSSRSQAVGKSASLSHNGGNTGHSSLNLPGSMFQFLVYPFTGEASEFGA